MNQPAPKAAPQGRGRQHAQASIASCPRTCRARTRSTAPRRPMRCTTRPATPVAAPPAAARLRQIGQDVSEQLEYVPAHFKVIRHVRPKLACVPARPSSRPQPRAGRSRAAWPGRDCWPTCWSPSTATTLPLYRQSRIYARDGVDIDRSTMAGWVDQSDALLDPLVAALGRYALAGAKVHADDTPVAVLDPGRGRTKTGRLWVYVRDDRPAAARMPRRPGTDTRPTARASTRSAT